MGNESTSAVVVTGGASGIGRASAVALAARGRPVALWDLDPDRAAGAADEITRVHGVPAVGLGIDVTDSSRFAEALERSRSVVGTVGGLVHAAGTVVAQPVGELDEAGWDFVMAVNLRAFPLLVQALLPDLMSSSGAAVVGISSIEGWIGNAAIPAYCASKAGLLGAVRSMAERFGPDGIRVNAVCPGYVETPMLAPALGVPDVRGRFEASSPLGRIGQPSEIGEPVAFLLSGAASFITGQALIVDGGVLAVD